MVKLLKKPKLELYNLAGLLRAFNTCTVHLHATWSIETLIIMLKLLSTGSKKGVIKEISQGKLFVVIKHKQCTARLW